MFMKIMVFHKRTVVVGVVILATVLTTLCFGRNKIQMVANISRDLPIYCVDTGEEKKVSISFDAAWGNGRYGTPIFWHFASQCYFPAMIT